MPNENTLPTPETRREMFLAAAAGENVEKPEPITREEMFLNAIGGGTGDSYTKAETDQLLGGKADLVGGKVPAAQLPSYVDDVLEYASTSAFPETGESGKIYISTDTNKTYRWGGSAYVEISESLALGETASTAYAGNKGKANADAIAKKPGGITTGKQYTIDGQTVTAGAGAEAFNDLTSNKASGSYSHAEGLRVTTSGNQSHAEGNGTTASGHQSHAEGNGTTASGYCSHAEGRNTIASGSQSHVEGLETSASSDNQHVQGKFNVEDANDTYAFIIGNGTANNARHNAFAVDWNGLIYVNGASTGVDVSALAPQSTTYTKDEVDTALAAKLNTADVDDALSSTSMNPVQNKAIQAPLARLTESVESLSGIARAETFTTVANQYVYTNQSFTVPAGKIAIFTASVFYNASKPNALKVGKNADPEATDEDATLWFHEVGEVSLGALSVSGITQKRGTDITYYIHAKYVAAGTNAVSLYYRII